MYFNFGGQLLSRNHNTNFNAQFKNKWQINGQFNRQSENISTTLLRGGPSFIMPGNQSFNLNLSTDHSKKLSFHWAIIMVQVMRKVQMARILWLEFITDRLTQFQFHLNLITLFGTTELQYVSTTGSDANPVYLFGKLDQKTLYFTFRINYTINPELSIEYYGQPFISAGKYTAFKKITDPNAGTFKQRFYDFTPSN